ncbi:hypothetical protein DXD67_11945 [Coprococcus comes]|uniref:Uncharacterized protein n=1 Tax=Coprococcus comes TaxID=410072 RepID=A0A3E4GN55_9FIRM|nr:hypothetical protein [Coprococcus comes]RGJ21822.1 hypothetical protein DXD67_11945 [Coprococcus comes]
MKKLNKIIPLILWIIMIVVFYYFSNRWIDWDVNSISYVVFKNIDSLSPDMLRIAVTLFFATMCGLPIIITKSKVLPYVYMAILIIGTIIAKEKFLYISIVIMGIIGFLFGGLVDIITSIICFLFPAFSVVSIWIVRIAQLLGHCVMIGILLFPKVFFEGIKDEVVNNNSKSNIVYKNDDFDPMKEFREDQKLETLKDIDYELKNRK